MVPWWTLYGSMLFSPDEGGGGEGEENQEPENEGDDVDEIEGLNEGGKNAIRAERERAKKMEKRFKEAQEQLGKLTKKHASQAEIEKAEAKEEGRKEALKEANMKVLKAEVKVAAAGKLKNPALAWALLEDAREDLMNDDGDIDNNKLSRELNKIVKDNPELAVGRTTRTGADFSSSNGGGGSNFSDAIRRRAGRG